MKFDLKTPCKECPFLKGSSTNLTLEPGRIPGIINAIRDDATFTCHKTLDLDKYEQQHCAGALAFLEREGQRNRPLRMAMAFGWYDPAKLKDVPNLIDG